MIPEDHEYAYLNARSTALREADLVLVVGTRLNYVFGFGEAPRINGDATIVQIDVDPDELARSGTIHYGVVGDARLVLEQLIGGVRTRAYPAILRPGAAISPTCTSRGRRSRSRCSPPTRCRSIRCGSARKCATSSIATPSSSSTARRS